jgi:ribosomal protein S27E
MAVDYDSHETVRRSDDYTKDDVPEDLVESLKGSVTVWECSECGNATFLWVRSGWNNSVECDECGNSGTIPG